MTQEQIKKRHKFLKEQIRQIKMLKQIIHENKAKAEKEKEQPQKERAKPRNEDMKPYTDKNGIDYVWDPEMMNYRP